MSDPCVFCEIVAGRAQTSRYTVTTWWHSGHPRGDAVRDALRACLSEWEVVADVHVTRRPAATGDDAHNITVHWDTTAPEWPDECWPMHAADALGHAAERVDGVTDAVAVCHDRPEPTTVVVDASPPRPPYRLPAGDQGGAANGTQIAVDGRSGPDATPTTGEPSQGLSEADLATIAARANAHSRRDILRLVAEVRRLEADLDRAVDRALEHRGGEAQARHQLARVTSRAEAAEADARELREDIGAAIRVLPGGTVSRPLADQVAALAAEVRRLRAHHEHCAWGAERMGATNG